MKASLKHKICRPVHTPDLTPFEQGLDLFALDATPAFPGDFPQPIGPPYPIGSKVWHYILVLGGCCNMQLPGKTLRLRRGDVFIVSPNCLHGYTGQKGKRFDRLVWVWCNPPLIPFIKPEEGQYLRIKLTEQKIRQLQHLYAACQKIVRRIDQFTQFKLLNVRMEIDLLLAQTHVVPDLTESFTLQFDLARHWIGTHLTMRDGIGALCQYLALSPATLNRLFHRQLKMSPETYLQKLRMKSAQTRLQSGNLSVKAIAYQLGYKHPNNFSRAYKRHVGVAPTEHIPHLVQQEHGPGKCSA